MTRSRARLAIAAVCGLTAIPASAAASPGAQHRHHESARPAAAGDHQVAPPQTSPTMPAMTGLSATQVLSGPLPTYPLSPASPFNATPSTYAPRPGAWPFHRPRGLFVLGGYALSADAPEPAPSIAGSTATPEAESIAPAAPQARPPVVEPSSPPVYVDDRPAPMAPVTLYVIPRCYAGNRPPADGMLAPGCDRAKMRTVTIR